MWRVVGCCLGLVLAPVAEASRYIVHFVDGGSAQVAASSLQVTGRRAKREAAHAPRVVRAVASGGLLMELPDGNPAHLARLDGVVGVEVDGWVTPAALPDPLWTRQWYLHEAQAGIEVEGAWHHTRGEGAVVAVLDTGVIPHAEFDGQLLPGYDFISDPEVARDDDGRDADPTDEGDWHDAGDCDAFLDQASSWHGTHVTGLVVAREGNQLGTVGVAPQARVLPVRVLGRCGGRLSDLADAIVWASGGEVRGVPPLERPVDVINLSLGMPGACGPTLRSAIAAARARGTVVVAAAGNDGAAASAYNPANCPGVVTVGAADRQGAAAWYSNHGGTITLVAPGGSLGALPADNLVSTLDQGSRGRFRGVFGYRAGTSMAAPLVSGVVALMRAADPRITVDAVARQLSDNARPMPGRCPRGCGAGLLDAASTLDAVVEDAGG